MSPFVPALAWTSCWPHLLPSNLVQGSLLPSRVRPWFASPAVEGAPLVGVGEQQTVQPLLSAPVGLSGGGDRTHLKPHQGWAWVAGLLRPVRVLPSSCFFPLLSLFKLNNIGVTEGFVGKTDLHCKPQNRKPWTSPAVQWLGPHASTVGPRVQSPVGERSPLSPPASPVLLLSFCPCRLLPPQAAEPKAPPPFSPPAKCSRASDPSHAEEGGLALRLAPGLSSAGPSRGEVASTLVLLRERDSSVTSPGWACSLPQGRRESSASSRSSTVRRPQGNWGSSRGRGRHGCGWASSVDGGRDAQVAEARAPS